MVRFIAASSFFCVAFVLFKSSEAFAVQRSDNLDLFRDDIAQVGGAIETFTFDILKTLMKKLDMPDEEDNTSTPVESTTAPQENPVIKRRKRGAIDDDLSNLCRKHIKCDLDARNFNDLKLEVKKLRELVDLIHGQQKLISILDKRNGTVIEKSAFKELKEITGNSTNEELRQIHHNLRETIRNLDETRQMIEAQTKKEQLLEVELLLQKDEIKKLRSLINESLQHIPKNDSIVGASLNETNARASNSDLSEIKKLIRDLPAEPEEDEPNESRALKDEILKIEEKLKKKKKLKQVKQLKELQRELNSIEEEPETNATKFLKQLQKALAREETDPAAADITSLDDLQTAIDRLQPKQDDSSAQFQAMLSKLIGRQKRPIAVNSRPQISDFRFPVAPQAAPLPYSYACPPYNPPSSRPPAPVRNIQYSGQQQQQPQQSSTPFFPETVQNNYYQEPVAPSAPIPEKPVNYKPEIGGDGQQKYQDDLRGEIDGLQSAIDGLNRPEYVQRPEDKAMIDDLERQINDLRGLVDNLNGNYGYRSSGAARPKRSVSDNEIDGEEADRIVRKMGDFLGRLISPEDKQPVDNIQEKINYLKKELGQNSNQRSASSPYSYFGIPSYSYDDQDKHTSLKTHLKQKKTDLFVDIVAKIMDKVVASIPVIIQKLFGMGDLNSYDYQDYDVQAILKNLGVFGYLPIVFLKLIRGFSYFLNVLKKNNFFRSFLVPITILGLVAGSVFFLNWWLQPNDDAKYIDYNSNSYNQNQNNNYNTNYKNDVAPNNNYYQRSYTNK